MMNENRNEHEIVSDYPIYNSDISNDGNNNNNNDNDNNNDQIHTNRSINNYWSSKSNDDRSNFSELLPETQEFDKYLEGENENEVEVEVEVEDREGGEGEGRRGREVRGGRDRRLGSTARYSNQ